MRAIFAVQWGGVGCSWGGICSSRSVWDDRPQDDPSIREGHVNPLGRWTRELEAVAVTHSATKHVAFAHMETLPGSAKLF